MFGDGDEIQPASLRCFDRAEQRARHPTAGVAVARGIAMAGVHMQITAIPAGAAPLGGWRWHLRLGTVQEPDARAPSGCHTLPDIGYRECEGPFATIDRTCEIGRGRIAARDGEVRLVASTRAAS